MASHLTTKAEACRSKQTRHVPQWRHCPSLQWLRLFCPQSCSYHLLELLCSNSRVQPAVIRDSTRCKCQSWPLVSTRELSCEDSLTSAFPLRSQTACRSLNVPRWCLASFTILFAFLAFIFLFLFLVLSTFSLLPQQHHLPCAFLILHDSLALTTELWIKKKRWTQRLPIRITTDEISL